MKPAPPLITQSQFTIVDIETTGLHPHRGDRIVEISLLRADFRGNVLSSFASLINPQQQHCASEIHGLSAADLSTAPTFGELIGDIYAMLHGAVIVGHNVRFDAGFLVAEANRSLLPPPQLPLLCTIELMRGIEPPASGNSLAACCARLQIPFEPRHHSGQDARATLEIFRVCLERRTGSGARTLADIGIRRRVPRLNEWPRTVPSGQAALRRE